MAFGDIISSSVGFLEVVIIILIVREVIRLFSGNGSAGSNSSGSGFKDAVGNLWGKAKNKWDKSIDEGVDRHKKEEEIEKGLIIAATEGENELIRIADGATKLKNGFNRPGEFLKALPEVESKLILRMESDVKAFRSNLLKERDEIAQEEKLMLMDSSQNQSMLAEASKMIEKQKVIISSEAYTDEDKNKARDMVTQLTAFQSEINKTALERGNTIMVINNTRKAIEDSHAKSKPLEDLITLNITNEIKRLMDLMKNNAGADPSKREHELNDLKVHSDKVLTLIKDIKMHYEGDVLANLKRCKEEIEKLKVSNEKVFNIYNGISFTARAPRKKK